MFPKPAGFSISIYKKETSRPVDCRLAAGFVYLLFMEALLDLLRVIRIGGNFLIIPRAGMERGEQSSAGFVSTSLVAAASDEAAQRFWNAEPGWLILWLGVLAVLIAVGWYILGKIRAKPLQQDRWAGQWLAKCRESYLRGELSDEEFREIKTTLAQQLQDELKEDDSTN